MPQIAPPFMGLPGLTVTTGRTPTHPLGIQALADRGREDILLDVADLLAPEIPAVTPYVGLQPGSIDRWGRYTHHDQGDTKIGL